MNEKTKQILLNTNIIKILNLLIVCADLSVSVKRTFRRNYLLMVLMQQKYWYFQFALAMQIQTPPPPFFQGGGCLLTMWEKGQIYNCSLFFICVKNVLLKAALSASIFFPKYVLVGLIIHNAITNFTNIFVYLNAVK